MPVPPFAGIPQHRGYFDRKLIISYVSLDHETEARFAKLISMKIDSFARTKQDTVSLQKMLHFTDKRETYNRCYT